MSGLIGGFLMCGWMNGWMNPQLEGLAACCLPHPAPPVFCATSNTHYMGEYADGWAFNTWLDGWAFNTWMDEWRDESPAGRASSMLSSKSSSSSFLGNIRQVIW